MVLLEIVRGKKNSSVQMCSQNNNSSSTRTSSSSSSSGVVYFPLLDLEMHEQGRYLQLADSRLEGRVEEDEVQKLVKIAWCCVQEDPALRPSMANVVGMLEGGLPLADPRIQSLKFLRFYGRRFMDASQQNHDDHDQEFVMWKSGDGTNSTATCNSLSCLSAHQLSGPR